MLRVITHAGSICIPGPIDLRLRAIGSETGPAWWCTGIGDGPTAWVAWNGSRRLYILLGARLTSERNVLDFHIHGAVSMRRGYGGFGGRGRRVWNGTVNTISDVDEHAHDSRRCLSAIWDIDHLIYAFSGANIVISMSTMPCCKNFLDEYRGP